MLNSLIVCKVFAETQFRIFAKNENGEIAPMFRENFVNSLSFAKSTFHRNFFSPKLHFCETLEIR
jgi:hypothetical protein